MNVKVIVKQNVKEFLHNGQKYFAGELVELPATEADLQVKNNIVRECDEMEAARLKDFMANRPAELLARKIKEAEEAQAELEAEKAEKVAMTKEIALLKDKLARAENTSRPTTRKKKTDK